MKILGVDEIYIDRMSGKNTDRPELKKLLAYVRRGDTVVVESISRFARNTRDLLELVEQLTAKGVEFVSQKESIDTSTPTGKFMLTVFGAVAELEREYILQRQREGIEIAKTKGKYKGRKPISSPGEAAGQNLKQVKWTSEKNPDGSYTVAVRGISPAWNNARLGIDFTYTEDSEYYWAGAQQAYINGDYYDDNLSITTVMAIIYGNEEMANTALIWSMVS